MFFCCDNIDKGVKINSYYEQEIKQNTPTPLIYNCIYMIIFVT